MQSIRRDSACGTVRLMEIKPAAIEGITIQENETGSDSYDGIITTGFSGYTGSGCVDTDNDTGNGIGWKICVPSSETYTLKWRCSNDDGNHNDRPGQVKVDGTVLASNVSFNK